MTILALTELNTAQTYQIESLATHANRHDHTNSEVSFDNQLNFYSSMSSWFLAYRGDVLAGYVSLFAPRREECELSALTHPRMRRQGVFKSLYAAAFREMDTYSYKHLLFVCPHDSKPGKEAAARCGAAYAFTEYAMRYDRNRQIGLSGNRLVVMEACYDQMAELTALSRSVFPDTSKDTENMFKTSLNLPNRKVLAAALDHKIIGMCSLGVNRGSVSINGFGIEPEFRNKGYGREFLEAVLAELVAGDREIRLDVDSTNMTAFHLYRQVGFTIASAVDYYQMQIKMP